MRPRLMNIPQESLQDTIDEVQARHWSFTNFNMDISNTVDQILTKYPDIPREEFVNQPGKELFNFLATSITASEWLNNVVNFNINKTNECASIYADVLFKLCWHPVLLDILRDPNLIQFVEAFSGAACKNIPLNAMLLNHWTILTDMMHQWADAMDTLENDEGMPGINLTMLFNVREDVTSKILEQMLGRISDTNNPINKLIHTIDPTGDYEKAIAEKWQYAMQTGFEQALFRINLCMRLYLIHKTNTLFKFTADRNDQGEFERDVALDTFRKRSMVGSWFMSDCCVNPSTGEVHQLENGMAEYINEKFFENGWIITTMLENLEDDTKQLVTTVPTVSTKLWDSQKTSIVNATSHFGDSNEYSILILTGNLLGL